MSGTCHKVSMACRVHRRGASFPRIPTSRLFSTEVREIRWGGAVGALSLIRRRVQKGWSKVGKVESLQVARKGNSAHLWRHRSACLTVARRSGRP